MTIPPSSAPSRRDFLRSATACSIAIAGAAMMRQAATQEPEWTQTSEKKIRIGVVGGGFGLTFHWHEHPNCIVAAVSDLIPERKKMLQDRYKCEKAYDSLEELVKDPDIDAVAVFTPAPDHARHIILCMENGKHAISAVPGCLTLEEAAAMKETKERTGLKYMNAETSYYRPETITMRRLFQEKVLGDAILYSEGEYYHPLIGRRGDSLSFRDGERTWRYGYPPMLYITHSTAFLIGVTRERLTKVSCIGTGDPNEQSLKDNVYGNPFGNSFGLFETNQGHAFRGNVAWDVWGHGERAQWFGNKGAFYMEGWNGTPYGLLTEEKQDRAPINYLHLLPAAMRYDSGHGASHPFITNEFIMALVEEREPAVDIYESLAFCVPGIVAHQSALKGGERLAIPCFDKTPAL